MNLLVVFFGISIDIRCGGGAIFPYDNLFSSSLYVLFLLFLF